MPDPRLPGPGSLATRARCRLPAAGPEIRRAKFLRNSSNDFETVRKGRFSILRNISKKKFGWSNFFVGGGFPAIWNHSKPPGNGFQPPGTVLVSFGRVSKLCGRLSTSCEGFPPTWESSGKLPRLLANLPILLPMEFHWIQWNSNGSNGIPLDPMEFNWIQWNPI